MADAGKSALIRRLLAEPGCSEQQEGGGTEDNGLPFRGLVVDGGMGTELKKMGIFKNLREYTTLWSAAALLHEEGRQAIKAAHRSFIDAGAQMVITNTYACTLEILGKGNLQHRQAELIECACRLAHEAVAESGKPCLVAGSLPPLGVSYRPDLVQDTEALKSGYEGMAQALDDGKVDVFIAETMSCVAESLAAATAAHAHKKPVFVATTLDKPKRQRKRQRSSGFASVLRSGESLGELTKAVDSVVDGFLINCCSPEAATLGLQQLLALTAKPTGVYANHFEPIPRDWKLDNQKEGKEEGLLKIRSDLDPIAYAKYAELWANMGAMMIGGCCGISPEHIRVLERKLASECLSSSPVPFHALNRNNSLGAHPSSDNLVVLAEEQPKRKVLKMIATKHNVGLSKLPSS